MNIKDLVGENEVIHCLTKEEFNAIRAMNPDDTCGSFHWCEYKEDTCYRPHGDKGRGTVIELEECKKRGYIIRQASEFILPKRGEWVEVKSHCEEWKRRIFVSYTHGATSPYQCVTPMYEKEFKQGKEFDTCNWKHFRRIPQANIKLKHRGKKHMITEDQAQQIDNILKAE